LTVASISALARRADSGEAGQPGGTLRSHAARSADAVTASHGLGAIIHGIAGATNPVYAIDALTTLHLVGAVITDAIYTTLSRLTILSEGSNGARHARQIMG